uniref:Olfactory receptor n=1 Tax=Sphenodon punctatus TaxID=8508 RepID=A0A8D0GBZ4_SPHPU
MFSFFKAITAMVSMKEGNCTVVSEFILLGFGKGQEPQLIPFLLFLGIYVTILLGNIIIVFVIMTNRQLHTPMYFLLTHLSSLDFCYSSVIAPKALVSFLSTSKGISYKGCAAQLFFFAVFVSTEAFILAAMAYDRFTAICNPLHYSAVMSKQVCIQLVVGSYFCGFLNSMVQTGLTFRLHYCGPNELDHFFCDVPALMNLSNSDKYVNELVLFSLSGVIIMSTSLAILVSYVYIVVTILQIHSSKGRQKAFSTCTSHMVTVSLFYGTVTFMYAQPSSLSSLAQSKVVSVFYTLVIPMLNPLIYSLRNKDVKEAFRRTMRKKIFGK